MAFQGAVHELQDGAQATGNGKAIPVKYTDRLNVQVVISNTATVTFEETVDGTNWEAVAVLDRDDMATWANNTTASGTFLYQPAGAQQFRARISAYTSGTVDVNAGSQL